MNKVSCAIYVRKSTEKGLEQEFNSLHNQEEACKNYILSQAFNGWEHYKTYTDGGISGGTMKRPALKEMLADIKKGLVNVVVVYKVDRLSRSIGDFHNMMKEFEKFDCNFVSITQAFDTSTSMGKLTLNMLLSFAQFEREVSSERIRDKIAASKKKGMWTGGNNVLGYDVVDKKLVINSKEAEQVKHIFEKYLEVGSLRGLRDYLRGTDIRGKKWTTKKGRVIGGKAFITATLSKILRKKIYIGRIEHKRLGTSYPGRHKPILEKALFNKVQELIDKNQNNHSPKYRMNGNLLSKKLFDSQGREFKNQKSSKREKRKYRYYALKGKYIPAGDIEDITIKLIKGVFNSDLSVLQDRGKVMEFKGVDFDALPPDRRFVLIREMIEKIICHKDKLLYFIRLDDLTYLKAFKKHAYINTGNVPLKGKAFLSDDRSRLVIEKRIHIDSRYLSNRFIGKGKKMVSVAEKNNNLIKALSIGWRYGRMIKEGKSVREISKAEGRARRTIYKYLNLNYLSPNIANDIMESRAPTHVNLQVLFNIASKHTDFNDQEKEFYRSWKA